MRTDNQRSANKGCDEYFTRSELAKYLKISPRTVSLWQAQGRIPTLKLGRKCVRFRRRDIDEALQMYTR